MHLDCCFSILGDSVCLMLDEMMGEESPTRRLVDEYARSGPGAPYELKRSGVEFAAYMRSEGYTIIPVKAEDQLVSGEKGLVREKAPNKNTHTSLTQHHPPYSSTAATCSTWATPRSSPCTRAPRGRSSKTPRSAATCKSSTLAPSPPCTAPSTARPKSSSARRASGSSERRRRRGVSGKRERVFAFFFLGDVLAPTPPGYKIKSPTLPFALRAEERRERRER